MQVDNTTAAGFANQTMTQKCSKAMDMRFHRIKDRVHQQQFLVYYRPSISNLANPFTKHHMPTHMQLMRPKFLHPLAPNLAHGVSIPLWARACQPVISQS
jgi:hypothetical protein